MILAAAAAAALALVGAHDQTTRISLAGERVDGANESVRGRIVIATPTPAFRRTTATPPRPPALRSP